MTPAIPTSTSRTIYRTNTARIVTANLRPLGAVAIWLALVAGLLGLAGSQPAFGAAAISTLVLGPLFYGLGMWSAKKGDVTGSRGSVLECSREGVSVDGRLVIPRGEVDNGSVAPDLREGGSLVLLGRKADLTPKHTLHAKNAEEANAILAALGLDVAHNTLVHREAGWFAYGSGPTTILGGAFVIGMLSFIPLLVLLHGNALAMLPAALGMTAFFGTMWTTRSEIVVGADGVLLRWLGKQRYCAFADVERCEATERGVILHRRDGSRFEVVVDAALRADVAQLDRVSIRTRIEEAWRAHRDGPRVASDLDPSALARNERPIADWIRELRGRLELASHRVGALVPEALWDLVQNPDAEANARAAAAVVLGPSLDEAGRARLRETAASTASVHLRVALESTANGDDAALADALAELAPSETKAAGGSA